MQGEETEAPTGSEPGPRQRWGLEEPAIQGLTAEGARHITPPHPQDPVINSLLPWKLPLPLGEQCLGRKHLG